MNKKDVDSKSLKECKQGKRGFCFIYLYKRPEIFVIFKKKCYSIFRMIFCKVEMIPKELDLDKEKI